MEETGSPEESTKRTAMIVLQDTSPLYTRMGFSAALDALAEMNALEKYRPYEADYGKIHDILVCCSSGTGTKVIRYNPRYTFMIPCQKKDRDNIEAGIERILSQYELENKIPLVVSDAAYMETVAEAFKRRHHAVAIIF